MPHHLLDLVDPDEAFTVAHWVEAARELVPEVDGARPAAAASWAARACTSRRCSTATTTPPSRGHPEMRQRLADELEVDGLEPLAARLATP